MTYFEHNAGQRERAVIDWTPPTVELTDDGGVMAEAFRRQFALARAIPTLRPVGDATGDDGCKDHIHGSAEIGGAGVRL